MNEKLKKPEVVGLRNLVGLITGIAFYEKYNTKQIQALPIDSDIARFSQDRFISILFFKGFLERLILKNLYPDKYKEKIMSRILSLDLAPTERKTREYLDKKHWLGAHMDEEDVPDYVVSERTTLENGEVVFAAYYGEAAKRRMVSLRQFFFMLMIAKPGQPLSIPGYPDIPLEQLILDTAQWPIVCGILGKKLHHFPYFDKEFKGYSNEELVNLFEEELTFIEQNSPESSPEPKSIDTK
jgi:hypothetical protein